MRSKFSNSVIISDHFPVPAGKYKLKVVLNNSVKGELIYFSENITVKDEINRTPVVFKPLVTKNVKEIRRFVFLPYKFGDIEVKANPNYNFGKKDPLYIVGGIDIGTYKNKVKGILEIQDIFNRARYSKNYTIDIKKDRVTYLKKFINIIPPGNYKVRVKVLSEKGEILDMKESSFSVNLKDFAVTPGNIHKVSRENKLFSYFHMIGHQYRKLGKFDKAFRYLKRAYEFNKEFAPIIEEFSELLLIKKNYQKVLNIVEVLKDKKRSKFTYHLIKGKALFIKGSFNEAIDNLEKANKMYDSDIRVLNVLGMAYLKTGEKKQAIKVLNASLKINSGQKKVKALLKKLNSN